MIVAAKLFRGNQFGLREFPAPELAYDADVQIGGLLASLGSRLIEPVASG